MRKIWHYVISEKCNMNCSYCNVDKQSDKKSDFLDFLDFYDKNIFGTPDNYQFDIFGGEPLLYSDTVFEICSFLMSDDNCKKILIPTNGSIFNSKIKNILELNKVQISLSHDGIHQKLNRGNHNIHIDKFIKYGNIKKVHTMVNGNSFQNDSNILINQTKYFQKLGLLADITLVRDTNSFSMLDIELFKTGYDKYIDYFYKNILNDIMDYNDIPSIIGQYMNTFLNKIIRNIEPIDCETGINYFAIKENKVISCERFTSSDDELKLIDYRTTNKYTYSCDTCFIKDFCIKGCPYEIIKNNGVIEPLCEIYKHIILKCTGLIDMDNDQKIINLFLKGNK